MFAPTAETFREFLEQQDLFVFFMTIYVGAGLIANDRRANALQIYLSKPLLRSEYIAGKAAVLFFFLMLVTWVPAILLLLVQVHVRRQLPVPEQEPVSVPGDHRRLAAAGAAGDVHDAGAVVALEEQPLRGDSLRRHHVLHGRHLRRALRHHRQLVDVVDLADRRAWRRSWTSSSASRRRYMTPWQVSLIVIVGLIVVSISVLERRVRGVEVVT